MLQLTDGRARLRGDATRTRSSPSARPSCAASWQRPPAAEHQTLNWNETIAVLEKVETLMSGRSAEEMEKSLEECQGAFLVSAETKLSAEKYVEGFKATLEHLAEFNKLANDIRNLDNAYPDLQYQAWAACVKRARCKGTPESACADKKAAGNWPDVP